MKARVSAGTTMLLLIVTAGASPLPTAAADDALDAAIAKSAKVLMAAGVERERVDRDASLIVDNYAMLAREASARHPRESPPKVVTAAWLELTHPRVGQVSAEQRRKMELFAHADAAVRRDLLVSTMQGMGILVVDSNPEGATVRVGGVVWTDPTDTKGFVSSGTYTIIITKDGFPPHQGSVTVKIAEETVYKANL